MFCLIIHAIKDGGVVRVTRLAGMMLSSIAVQQIINGVTQMVRGLSRSPVGAGKAGACLVVARA